MKSRSDSESQTAPTPIPRRSPVPIKTVFEERPIARKWTPRKMLRVANTLEQWALELRAQAASEKQSLPSFN